MKYLIAGLLIGGFLGQMFGYAVAGQHPRIVEVKLEESAPVQKMRRLMATMPLAIKVTELGTPPDEIGLLIAMGENHASHQR